LLILLLPNSVALTLSAPRHRMLACCGLALAGMATPWMATAGAFTLAGALGPFLEQTMLINLQHYPADPPASLLSALMAGLVVAPLVWLVATLVITVSLWRWLRASQHTLAQLATPVTALALTSMGALLPFVAHLYPHYWLQVLPWATLLAALGM